ncbi:MAG: hypothetical protein HQL53_12160 [Magnetococcales bacterium]|nr:hypothetical protein [Magnetococcales bacterium]
MHRPILWLVFGLLLMLVTPITLQAEPADTAVDEALSGFDEPASPEPSGAGSAVDDALSGFDESVPTAASGGDSAVEEALSGFDEPDSSAVPSPDNGDASTEDALSGFEDANENAAPSLEGGESESVVDEALSGFEESADPSDNGTESATPSDVTFGGSLRLRAVTTLDHDPPASSGDADWRGLTRLQPELFLEADWRLPRGWKLHGDAIAAHDFSYEIKGRERYEPGVLRQYESDFTLREAWISGSPASWMDLKLGRQIVVWGQSDLLRVVDLLNPLDQRYPGLTDLEDLRRPLTMSRMDLYFHENWSLSLIGVHELSFHKSPVYGHDFYPFDLQLPTEIDPAQRLSNTEWGVALQGRFSGWDLALHAADYYNDDPHTELTAGGTRMYHADLKMVGATVGAAWRDFLFKGEGAWIDGFRAYNLGTDDNYNRTDLLLGVEYSGFTDTTLSLEVVNRHINGFNSLLSLSPDLLEEDSLETAFSMVRNFNHETTTLTLVAGMYGGSAQGGAYERIQLDYDINDSWTISGGLIFYQKGNLAAFQKMEDRDRLFMTLEYAF